MSFTLHTYSPICLPLNWKSELLEDALERFTLLKNIHHILEYVDVLKNPWPTGYGSLEHDNLPLLYQPAALLSIPLMVREEPDVNKAILYCYDNCLAVLYIELDIDGESSDIDDLGITLRIEYLSVKYLKPLLCIFYQYEGREKLITPVEYKVFTDTEASLCSAKPLWVARMLVQEPSFDVVECEKWLKNVDRRSEFLMLGSGNSVVSNQAHLNDVHRVMVMSQFQSALMCRIENLLKSTLKAFNAAYFNKEMVKKLKENMALHQQRNDHIEYINIQFSASRAGMQGKRRCLLEQFELSWQFTEHQSRIDKLSSLIQERLNRVMSAHISGQNRGIQTLLAFLGALSLLSLVVDLSNLHGSSKHSNTYGILDVFDLLATENILNITIILVVIITLYFYRNHE